MAADDQLNFVAYLEPQKATREWYRDVLYQLWCFGLSFCPHWKKILRWEEELQNPPEFFIAGAEGQVNQLQLTLAQCLDRAVTAGSCTLDVYDKGFQFLLALQPQADETVKGPDSLKTLGKIEIHYNRSYLNTDRQSSHDILPFYLQTWAAHVHWAEVCCTLLDPLYALSFQLSDLHIDALGDVEGKYIEDPLLMNKLPILSTVLLQPRIQYFGPQLLTEQNTWSLQRKPYQFSEFLPTGGLLVVPHTIPFNYGYGIGQIFLNQSRSLFENDVEEINEKKEEESNRLIARGNAIRDLYVRRFLAH